MKKTWQKCSLALKFSVILTISISLAGLILGTLLIRVSTRSYLREKQNTLNMAVRMLAVHLEEYMGRLLAETEQLEQMLSSVAEQDRDKVLRIFTDSRPEIQAMRYEDRHGRSTATGNPFKWPESLLSNEPGSRILPAQVIGGLPVVTLTVVSGSGRVAAYVNLRELSRQQGLLNIRLGESGHPYLMDSRGIVLSHRFERYVGRPIEELIVLEDGAPATVDLFTAASQSLLEYSLEQSERLAGVYLLPKLGLIAGFSQSLDEIRLPLERMRTLLWVSVAALTLLVIVLGIFLGQMVTRPLKFFLSQLEQIQQGQVFSISESTVAPEISLMRNAVNKLIGKLHEISVSTIASLVLTLEARDSATMGHSQRVAKIACYIGESFNISTAELRILTRAAILHDVGKISVPDAVLLKPEQLSQAEKHLISKHPAVAVKILTPLLFLKKEIEIIKQHHERIDGTGYPLGLKGEDINPLAKILSVADAYEAMTANRPYRKALTHYEAVSRLRDGRGSQFDEKVVDTFINISERYQSYHQGIEREDISFGLERA